MRDIKAADASDSSATAAPTADYDKETDKERGLNTTDTQVGFALRIAIRAFKGVRMLWDAASFGWAVFRIRRRKGKAGLNDKLPA